MFHLTIRTPAGANGGYEYVNFTAETLQDAVSKITSINKDHGTKITCNGRTIFPPPRRLHLPDTLTGPRCCGA